MTPKKEADKLVECFKLYVDDEYHAYWGPDKNAIKRNATQCALICLRREMELWKAIMTEDGYNHSKKMIEYLESKL